MLIIIYILRNIFQRNQYRTFVLINMRNMNKSQLRSCKLMLHEHLVYHKQVVQSAMLIVFGFFVFQNYYEK